MHAASIASPPRPCPIAYGRSVRRVPSVIGLVAVIGCAHPHASVPAPAPGRISITSPSCIAPGPTDSRLRQVLAEHRADKSGLVVEVGGTASETGTDVTLRVLRSNGDVGLDRRYSLGPADCDSAPQLLALAVDRWLTSFPEWAEPPPPPVPPPVRWIEIAIPVAANGITPPLGVEAEAGVLVDWGNAANRIGGTALARTGIPQRAGDGKFREVAALAGVAWRHRTGAWETRVELRGGGLRVSGQGFAEDAVDWIPWGEGAVGAGRRFGFGVIGVELAATPIAAHATTKDGLVSEDIPRFRLGISGTFDVR
jgi:hypothetical protein